jgi:hypothetical protein
LLRWKQQEGEIIMVNRLRKDLSIVLLVGLVILASSGCGGTTAEITDTQTIDPANFVDKVDNPYITSG